MKRFSVVLTSLAFALYLGGAGAAFAQGKPAGRPGGGPPSRPSTPAATPERPSPKGGTSNTRENPNTTHEKKSVDEILAQNSKLSSQISTLTGMGAQESCAGFKNLGQCVAAAHVSQNLGIPFADLKTKVTGTDSVSLGKAIKEMKPEANASAEAKKAEKQAKADLKKSGS